MSQFKIIYYNYILSIEENILQLLKVESDQDGKAPPLALEVEIDQLPSIRSTVFRMKKDKGLIFKTKKLNDKAYIRIA